MTGRLIPCIGQDGEFASDKASRQAACEAVRTAVVTAPASKRAPQKQGKRRRVSVSYSPDGSFTGPEAVILLIAPEQPRFSVGYVRKRSL